MSGVTKTFTGPAGEQLTVLQEVNLTVAAGESIAIVGPSGGGKTTLLNLIGGLLRPCSGEISVGGNPLSRLSDQELSRLRNEKIGFIFQGSYLLPALTVLENIMVPTFFQGKKREPKMKIMEKSIDLAEEIGLGERINHLPHQLSLGQRRRVAIARALINDPGLLLADEPTNDLDPKRAEQIGQILFDLVQKDIALVMVTHHPQLAARADRRYLVSNSCLQPVMVEGKESENYGMESHRLFGD
jgi:putative ABC transport system ATP-binding protein